MARKAYKQESKVLKHVKLIRFSDEHMEFLQWMINVDTGNGESPNIGSSVRDCVEKMMQFRDQQPHA